jgi:hypothetical protein
VKTPAGSDVLMLGDDTSVFQNGTQYVVIPAGGEFIGRCGLAGGVPVVTPGEGNDMKGNMICFVED